MAGGPGGSRNTVCQIVVSPAMMIGGETVAVVEETEEKVLRLQVGLIMMDRSRSEQIRG